MKTTKIIRIEDVGDRMIAIRGEHFLLDSDVAALYNVETREINQAVKNNPAKFPRGYIIDLTSMELYALRSKFLIANPGASKTRAVPKAFTEKGLYMLATILKSPQATATTIAIVGQNADGGFGYAKHLAA
jgi:hypothetical protein